MAKRSKKEIRLSGTHHYWKSLWKRTETEHISAECKVPSDLWWVTFQTLSVYQCHYPSLLSVTHKVVAPLIVSEAAVITWQGAEKMSETMRSDNDKFVAYSLHSLVLVTECCFSNENGASEYSRQTSHLPPTCCMQLICYNCAASLFCFKEGGFVGKMETWKFKSNIYWLELFFYLKTVIERSIWCGCLGVCGGAFGSVRTRHGG